MRVHHRGAHIVMAEQLLDRPDVLAGFTGVPAARFPVRWGGSRCVANECRSACGLARTLNPAATAAAFTARCSTVSCRWSNDGPYPVEKPRFLDHAPRRKG